MLKIQASKSYFTNKFLAAWIFSLLGIPLSWHKKYLDLANIWIVKQGYLQNLSAGKASSRPKDLFFLIYKYKFYKFWNENAMLSK